MRVLAFRHVPFEGLGLIEPALASRGIAFDYADLYAGDAPSPDISGYDGLIFLGGPMSANDPLPYLHQEMRLMERAMKAETPLLGVCLGAQMIAKTLGARVYRNKLPEIGWFDIHLTEAAKTDALFGRSSPLETGFHWHVFHWHYDTFDPPSGTVLLASSERTEQQAFRYQSTVYGLQFHLEVTSEMVVNWCEQDRTCGAPSELVPPDPRMDWSRLNYLAESVFGGWCDLLSSASRRSRAGRP